MKTNKLNLYLKSLAVVVMTAVVFVNLPHLALAANPLFSQTTAIVARTNQLRAEAGLSPLNIDAQLTLSATNKANDMATRGYFDHGNPDGYRMAYWINGAGYTYSLAGENLAKGFSDLDRLMNAWIASPSHYKNLVEPKFTDIGIGMAEGWYENQPTLFIVQHFGATATSIIKDTAPLVSVTAPLVETVAGSTDSQTVINDGPANLTGDSIDLMSPPQFVGSFPQLIETAQASPLDTPVQPASNSQFWPIFALMVLALIGYLDEFLPLWAETSRRK